jgi:hypothetical protein
MEPKGLVTCWQEPATYPEPDESSAYHIHLRHFYLHLVLSSAHFLSGFLTVMWRISYCPLFATHLNHLILSLSDGPNYILFYEEETKLMT